MKRLRVLLPVILSLILLTGCVFYFPIPANESAAPTETTELPISSEISPSITAEDIYWRAKFAGGERITQYRRSASVQLQYIDGEIALPVTLHYDTHTMLDAENCAVNLLTDVQYELWGEEEALHYQEFYRDEDDRLIYYCFDEQTGECTREVIDLNGKTPYQIILDFTIRVIPWYLPEDLAVEPQTRLLNEREVYVLTYRELAPNVLGYTDNSATDELLEKRWIPVVWYVDAESYQTVSVEYALDAVDDLLGQLIGSMYGVEFAEEMICAINGFSICITDLCFDPVEVPQIPEDIWEKAWQNAGLNNM